MGKNDKVTLENSDRKRNDYVDKSNSAYYKFGDAVTKGGSDVEIQKRALREWQEVEDEQIKSIENGEYHIETLRFEYNDDQHIINEHNTDYLQDVYVGEFAQTRKKAAGKQIAKYWENASYNQQKERKHWNEEGKKKAQAKLNEARNNWKYFRKRYDEVKTSTQSEFYGSYYNSQTGAYGPKKFKMDKQQYLNHCAAETARWVKEMDAQKKHIANYNNGIKESTAAMQRMETETKAKNAKKTLPKDSEKANKVKRKMKRTKELPEALKTPRVVQDKLTELGNDYKLVTLSDSKGNRIYCFEKDGEHAAVMTHIKGKEPSKYMEVKSDEMKTLVSEAGKQHGKGDFTNIIGKMKDLDVINGAKGIDSSALSAQFNPTSIPDTKIKATPKVMVVPKMKKNGKPSKKNFNIQLRDANGRIFELTKDMMKNAVTQKNAYTTSDGQYVDHSVRVDETWNKYVEAAKEGKLSPETVASFFKGQANLGETNAKADGSTITLNNAEKPIETGSVPPAVVDETTKDNKSPKNSPNLDTKSPKIFKAQRER